jgi:hypothetical protein
MLTCHQRFTDCNNANGIVCEFGIGVKQRLKGLTLAIALFIDGANNVANNST